MPLQMTLPSLGPKRLSTNAQHRGLHTSTTLRSDAVTRLALQAEMPADTVVSVPALGVSAAAVVRTGRGRRNKVCLPVDQLALLHDLLP